MIIKPDFKIINCYIYNFIVLYYSEVPSMMHFQVKG